MWLERGRSDRIAVEPTLRDEARAWHRRAVPLPEDSRLARWAWTATALAAVGSAVIAWEVWPAALEWLLSKEGLIEQVSHALLALSAGVWLGLGRSSPRAIPVALAVVSVLLLLEEIDWGAIYGLDGLGDRLERALGDPNLHNVGHGASYALFGVPLVAYFAAPSRWLGAYAPTADERLAMLGTGLLLVQTNGPREALAQEGLEAILYAVLLGCGVRCLRARRGSADHVTPPPATIPR